jgi:hypothetical protein
VMSQHCFVATDLLRILRMECGDTFDVGCAGRRRAVQVVLVCAGGAMCHLRCVIWYVTLSYVV